MELGSDQQAHSFVRVTHTSHKTECAFNTKTTFLLFCVFYKVNTKYIFVGGVDGWKDEWING
jgi:hypothetical protein